MSSPCLSYEFFQVLLIQLEGSTFLFSFSHSFRVSLLHIGGCGNTPSLLRSLMLRKVKAGTHTHVRVLSKTIAVISNNGPIRVYPVLTNCFVGGSVSHFLESKSLSPQIKSTCNITRPIPYYPSLLLFISTKHCSYPQGDKKRGLMQFNPNQTLCACFWIGCYVVNVKGAGASGTADCDGAPTRDPMVAPWGGVPNPGLFSQTRSQLD